MLLYDRMDISEILNEGDDIAISDNWYLYECIICCFRGFLDVNFRFQSNIYAMVVII